MASASLEGWHGSCYCLPGLLLDLLTTTSTRAAAVVSIKQLNRDDNQGNKEFLVEVLMLSLLHHQNLVNLVGFCAGEQRLIVYEYMPLGSLEDHLHGTKGEKQRRTSTDGGSISGAQGEKQQQEQKGRSSSSYKLRKISGGQQGSGQGAAQGQRRATRSQIRMGTTLIQIDRRTAGRRDRRSGWGGDADPDRSQIRMGETRAERRRTARNRRTTRRTETTRFEFEISNCRPNMKVFNIFRTFL